MSHPLDFVPNRARKPAFFTILVLAFVLFALFQVLNQPLTTAVAPYGIVSHQLAWTPDRARAILNSWDERSSNYAAFGLGLDYLFMPVYALAVALGSLLAAGRHKDWLSVAGSWAAYGIFAGIFFDALENGGQVDQLLNGTITSPVTVFVGVCAILKFFLLFLGILYGLTGWILPRKG